MMENNLRELVDLYIQEARPGELEELKLYKQEKSFIHALEHAALATDWQGRKYQHQWRIQSHVLQQSYTALFGVQKAIRHATSFKELHRIIEQATSRIHGLGELYIYDTALRIGAHLKQEPTDIYLHAGTRQGARALGYRGPGPLSLVNLRPEHKELLRLPAHQIEDFLCLFREEFGQQEPSRKKKGCKKVSRRRKCYFE
jgi:hypothetical protein